MGFVSEVEPQRRPLLFRVTSCVSSNSWIVLMLPKKRSRITRNTRNDTKGIELRLLRGEAQTFGRSQGKLPDTFWLLSNED